MVGKDCVAIASDLRLGNQAMLVARNFEKVRVPPFSCSQAGLALGRLFGRNMVRSCLGFGAEVGRVGGDRGGMVLHVGDQTIATSTIYIFLRISLFDISLE